MELHLHKPIQQNKRLTLRFLMPSWSFSFSKNEWKKSDLSTCLGATQRASMSAPTKKKKDMKLATASILRWVILRANTNYENRTFRVHSEPIGTKCEYFAAKIWWDWRWEVLQFSWGKKNIFYFWKSASISSSKDYCCIRWDVQIQWLKSCCTVIMQTV